MTRKHNKLIHALELLRNLDKEIQAQKILIFLRVAEASGPIPMPKLQEMLDLSQAAVSRNVASLGELHWKKKRGGHGLVRSWDDPQNGRQKLVELTVAGRRLSDILNSLIGD